VSEMVYIVYGVLTRWLSG